MATETIGALKTRVLRLLRDESGDVYSDGLVEEALQQALDMLALKSQHWNALPFVARETVTLVAGQELYDIGTPPAAQRILRIEKVTRLDAGSAREIPLVPVDFHDKFRVAAPTDATPEARGVPVCYFVRADDTIGEIKIGVRPLPDDEGTVYVYHTSMGSDIVDDSSTIVFPRAFRHFILIQAAVMATAYAGDATANRLLQQQLGDAEQEREWLLARWQKDQSGVARPVWELDFQWG